MSYRNCSLLSLLKRVVYTDEKLKILDLIPSLDLQKLGEPSRRRSSTSRGTPSHGS